MNQIYNLDCMDGMKGFPDKYFSLAIVDPPYGINATRMNMGSHLKRQKDGYPAISTAQRLRARSDSDWDERPPGKEYFKELFRVSQNQIIWGGNYFDLPPTRGVIVWDKLQPWDNFSQVEIAWTSFDRAATIFRLSNTGGKNEERKIHPTQKPVELFRWLLSKRAKPGDIILDTHAGSGSLEVACVEMGFPFLAFEIDPYYCMGARERIEAAQGQTSLFGWGSGEED